MSLKSLHQSWLNGSEIINFVSIFEHLLLSGADKSYIFSFFHKENHFNSSSIYSFLSLSCPVIEDNGESLKFNSQFESGNLRKAVQVRK